MQNVTRQPLVLDYAERQDSPRRWMLALLPRAAAVAGGALLGVVVAALLARPTWTVSTLYSFPLNSNPAAPSDASAEHERQLQRHAADLQTPEALAAVEADIASRGWGTPPLGQADWLRHGYRVRAVPDSQLVEVSFTSHHPGLSADAADAFMKLAVSLPTSDGSAPTVFAAPATAERDDRYGSRAAGAIAGGGACYVAMALWTRGRRLDALQPSSGPADRL